MTPETDGWSRYELLVMDKLEHLEAGQDEAAKRLRKVEGSLERLDERVRNRAAVVAAIVSALGLLGAAALKAL